MTTTRFGLHSTALVYSASLAVLAAVAVGLVLLRSGGKPPATRADVPPGPSRPAGLPQKAHMGR